MAGKLNHGDAPKSDDKLEEEAAQHVASNAPLQLMTELLTRLRDMRFPWWTPDHLRVAYPAKERMKWLASRPELTMCGPGTPTFFRAANGVWLTDHVPPEFLTPDAPDARRDP